MARIRPKGLTMIETLVAIAVVVVLLGLLVVGLARTREQARRAACKNNLKQIGLALHVYASDHAGYFPRGPEGAYSSYSLGILFYEGSEYLTNTGILLCPGRPDATVGAWRTNGIGMDGSSGGLHASSTSYSYDHYKFAVIAPDVALIADEMGVEAPDLYGSPGTMSSTDYQTYNEDMPLRDVEGTVRTPLNSPNHGGKGQNVLYADAHVEWAPNPLAGSFLQPADPLSRDEIYSIRSRSDDPDAQRTLWPPSQADTLASDHSVISETRPPDILGYSSD